MSAFAVTFTVDGHKKRTNWKWQDGLLVVSGRTVRLKNEAGEEVASERLPKEPSLSSGDEIKLTPQVVVCIDGPVEAAVPATMPPNAAAPSARSAAGATATAARPRAAAAGAPAAGTALVPARRSGLRKPAAGAQRAFQRPRLAPVAAKDRSPEKQQAAAFVAALKPAGGAWQQCRPDVPVLPAQQLGQGLQQQRSEDDVLRLLNGPSSATLQPAHTSNSDAGAAQPAAKRQRTQQLPTAAAPKPRWNSFLQEENDAELEAELLEGLPVPATKQQQLQQGTWGAATGTSRPAPDTGLQSRWAASKQPVAVSPAAGRPAGPSAGFKPVVRPPQAATLAGGTQPQPGGRSAGLHSLQPATALQPIAGHSHCPVQQPQAASTAQVLAGAADAQGPPAWNVAVGGQVQLSWPSAAECAALQRRVAVPDAFSGVPQYMQVWCNALTEELNLKVAQVAQSFYSACSRQKHGSNAGGQPAGSKKGQQHQATAPAEAYLRKAGVSYYSNAELFIWKNNYGQGKKGGWQGKRGKQHEGSPDDAAEEKEDAAEKKEESVYLILKSGRQRSSDYRKDDLWLVSSTPDFRAGLAPGQLGDRSRLPWVAVARSIWHGPNQDGKFEVEWLSNKPQGLGKRQAVYAIKGPDASTELGMLALLHSGSLASLPLMPHLLGRPGSSAGRGLARKTESMDGPGSAACREEDGSSGSGASSSSSAAEQAEALVQKFKLNEEQSDVVRSVAAWCQPGKSAVAPICLVHGPFGSGKSTLLVAVLRFLLQQREQKGSPLATSRVLVAAHTNVAVDRVLLGLQETGCTAFLRLGSVRRISTRLLPQSLHCSEGKAGAVAELKQMLAEAGAAGDTHTQELLQQELALAEKGAERQRKKLLKTVPIVGVTCCSAMLSALDGQQFDIIILDECSQMVEPLSLVPLLRSKCRYLIAAGDPKQLPPVIASPSAVAAVRSSTNPAAASALRLSAGAPSAASGQGSTLHGLLRPLFVRLTALGQEPHLLRRQYRCAPAISAVPNQQFYSGRLLDGCSAEQRASLLPGLPSLVFLDVRGQEAYAQHSRSASNKQEAVAVVEIVQRLVQAGVRLSQVGVICFFRAQVALVQALLEKALQALREREQALQAQRARLESEATEATAAGQAARRGGSKVSTDGELDAASWQSGGDGGLSCSPGGSSSSDGDTAAAGKPGSVQVATVDAFQGEERDVIILTTTVTRPGTFASDACRLNVALTRARRNLIICGCAPALQQAAPAFAAVLQRCRVTPGGYSPNGCLPVAQQQPGGAQAVQAGLDGGLVQQQQQRQGWGPEDDEEGWEALQNNKPAAHTACAAAPLPSKQPGCAAAASQVPVGQGRNLQQQQQTPDELWDESIDDEAWEAALQAAHVAQHPRTVGPARAALPADGAAAGAGSAAHALPAGGPLEAGRAGGLLLAPGSMDADEKSAVPKEAEEGDEDDEDPTFDLL